MVTNQRVIDIVYHHIFQKEVFETPLERILNINYKQKGFFQSVLNYGDVEVQIVGLVDALVFKRVRNPNKIKDILWQTHKEVAQTTKSEFRTEDIPQIQQKIGYHSKKRIE